MIARKVFLSLILIILQASKITCTKNGSLVFVVDNTEHMTRDMGEIKREIHSIMDIILGQKSSKIRDVILIAFNDPDPHQGYPQVRVIEKSLNRTKIKEALNSLTTFGGLSDCPDYSLSGLQEGLEIAYPHSYFFVITHASPKDYLLSTTVKNLALRNDAQVIFVITPSPTCKEKKDLFDDYHDIAAATYGQVLSLRYRNDVNKILPYVSEMVSGERQVLVSESFEEYKWKTIEFTINGDVDYVILSASGVKVKLAKINGPTSPKMVPIVNTKNVKIYKLSQLLPGIYAVKIYGESKSTALVYSKVDFTFQFGFSVTKPTSLENTEKMSTINTSGHLAILVDDPDHKYIIISIQILSLNKELIEELPLQKVSSNVYSTNLFTPPNSTYLISVIANSKEKAKRFSKISQTHITPLLKNFSPMVVMEGQKKYQYNGVSSLVCKIQAFPQPVVTWRDRSGNKIPDGNVRTLQKATAYEYESSLSMLMKSPQTYTCEVSNNMGRASGSISVDVESPFTVPVLPPGVTAQPMYIGYKKDGDIFCGIKSVAPYTTNWFIFKNDIFVPINDPLHTKYELSNDNNILTIKYMNEKLEGRYGCHAVLKENPNITASLHQTVAIKHEAPKVEILTSPPGSVADGTSVNLECKIKNGYPEPQLTWQFKAISSNSYINIDQATGYEILKISNADVTRHFGYYKCNATNNQGSHSHESALVITSAPIVKLTTDKNVDNLTYNSPVTIKCEIKAYPQPNVVWKSNQINKSVKPTLTSTPNVYVSELNIKNVQETDKITCQASNNIGKNEDFANVNVLNPIVVDAMEGTTEAKYENDVEVDCKLSSSFPLRITWWRMLPKPQAIKPSKEFYISQNGRKLTIKKINIALQGRYKCVGHLLSNSDIHAQYTTRVKIIDLAVPVIEQMPSPIIIRHKTSITITCRVQSGHPKADIEWQFWPESSKQYEDLATKGDSLNIDYVTSNHTGYYKCVATNVVGGDHQEVQLIVQVPPQITSDENILYTGVTGDMVLRVPCKVVGYPRPIVTWLMNGTELVIGKKYIKEGDSLVISNPVETDTNVYTCWAKNLIDEAEKTFETQVTAFNPDRDTGVVSYIYIQKGNTKRVSCPSSPSDSVRWYKDGEFTNQRDSVLVFKEATEGNDGIYTCRASNTRGAQVYTFIVDVGYPPYLKNRNIREIIDWDGDHHYLDCSSVQKPELTKIEWFYNGGLIAGSTEETRLNVNTWGTYKCRLTNQHGTTEKEFDVTSSNCLLPRNSKLFNTPLLLDYNEDFSEIKWASLETMRQFHVIPNKKTIILSCQNRNRNQYDNSFQKFQNASEIYATCDREDKFLVDRKIYKFSDLQCRINLVPLINIRKKTCYMKNAQNLEIGFYFANFINVYDVCFDPVEKIPIYTKVVMTKTYNTFGIEIPWTKTVSFSRNDDDKYTCKGNSKCCYAKAQLVNSRDITHGPAAQFTTFIDGLNSVPQWQPCYDNSTTSWNALEESLRLVSATVWSGASNYIEKYGLKIPRYLWKVVRVSPTDTLAIVYVNDPYPTDADIMCGPSDLCNEVDWAKFSSYKYCCSLADFTKAFVLSMEIFN